MIKTAMYSAAYVLLLFWANIFLSVLCAEETPQEIIADLLEQESCGGCLEVTELVVEGGTNKTVLLFRKIEDGIQDIRLQVISRGADYGYAYYSRIDAHAKKNLRDIMWVYRPEDGKVRRYNSIFTTFLDTGIPPYLVDRAGWLRFYQWRFLDEGETLHGDPLPEYAFLPEVVIWWQKNGGIKYLTSLRLIVRGNTVLNVTLLQPHEIGGKIRHNILIVGPPQGPFTKIILQSVRFEKTDESWNLQVFHPERLAERRTPDLLSHKGETFAKIDFNN